MVWTIRLAAVSGNEPIDHILVDFDLAVPDQFLPIPLRTTFRAAGPFGS